MMEEERNLSAAKVREAKNRGNRFSRHKNVANGEREHREKVRSFERQS